MTHPTGLLQVEHIVPAPASELVASGTVVVRDQAGTLWCFPATYFAHDLKPYSENQSLDFADWHNAVTEALSPWYDARSEVQSFDFEATYREGLPPAAAAARIIDLVRSKWAKGAS